MFVVEQAFGEVVHDCDPIFALDGEFVFFSEKYFSDVKVVRVRDGLGGLVYSLRVGTPDSLETRLLS